MNSAVNLFRAGWVTFYSVYDYYTSLQGQDYKNDEYYVIRSKCHRRTAERILWLSITNRGVYFKGGQYIGNLDKIVPKEFMEVLEVLQDSGPKEDIHAIRTVIEYDTNKKMGDIFSWFDENAIAAASLAQVHKARLKDNNKIVAVKVQFPTLRSQYQFDFYYIEKLCIFSDWACRKIGFQDVSLISIFKQFKTSLIDELDFRREVKNAKITTSMFAENNDVYIPKVEDQWVTSRFFAMEFVEGQKINDKKGIEDMGLDPKEVSR